MREYVHVCTCAEHKRLHTCAWVHQVGVYAHERVHKMPLCVGTCNSAAQGCIRGEQGQKGFELCIGEYVNVDVSPSVA